MAKYTVTYQDAGKDDMTMELVRKHIYHLWELHNKGVLFLCGLVKDDNKALLIFEANSYAEAERYVQIDPLIVHAYYTYTIHELIEANPSNNFLFEDSQA